MRKSALLVSVLALCLAAVLVGCRDSLGPVSAEHPYLDRALLPPPTGGPPYVIIDRPVLLGSGAIQTLGRVITFGWHSGLETEPHFVRWFCMQVVDTNGNYNPSFDIVRDLNQNPSRYEARWSKWVPYKNPHGRTTTVGVGDTLALNRSHIFAVQARDFSGAVTTVFDRRTNVRRFIVSNSARPLLRVVEPYLGGFVFLGTNLRAEEREFAPGVDMNFKWRADAGAYGGQIVGYRYGWDVANIEDKNDWEVKFAPDVTSAPPRAFQSGVHTFCVEALDDNGAITLARIEVSIVPFTMERNLLWVDDFYTTDFSQDLYAVPTRTQYRQFWLGHCGKAAGFDAARDVYDVYYGYNLQPPEMSLIAKYKNVIWTYSSSPESGVWDNVILFTPESWISTGQSHTFNFLPVFLAKGGHLLTEGRSDRAGGLAAVLMPNVQVFPLNLKCEITGPSQDCSGDQSGVNSMPYRDYCVSVVDKIVGAIRTGSDMPTRIVRNYDVLKYSYKSDDVVTGTLSGLPDTLALWAEVTKQGRYFYPGADAPYPGGFTYVEVYDPAYWMGRDLLRSQPCFHPLYRMRSKNMLSSLDKTAMALCLTKYEDVVPEVASGIAVPAKSFHFGTELWFFNRQQVDQIMSVVFNEWKIAASL